MKILNVISSTNPANGGPIEAILQIAPLLIEAGHTSEIISFDLPDDAWLANYPLKVHGIGPSQTSYAYCPRFLPWLRQNAKNYDRIIVHGLWQYCGFGTWLALRDRKSNPELPPYYVYPHGMLDPWFKKTYPLKHLKKLLYWLPIEYWVLKDAAATFFTCEAEKELARQSFAIYKCNEVVVNLGTAKPPVDRHQQQQAFFDQFPHLKETRILLFLGRIHVKKGCDLLIEAFAQIANQDPNLQLVFAGPDQTNWQATLEDRAQDLGISSRITWTGMLLGDSKWGALHAAEALVLPSHQENFGFVVAEALACGTPVLISNKVNIWQEIESDRAGIVANDDLAGTVSLLQQWLALSPEQREEMGQRAGSCFLDRFEAHQAAANLIQALNKN
ncbi:glycosyl transferase group 1 [Thalassoporum mexicanum PCC 7367]|uniref:glycosyltransferase n=1 Tax=Thalassoporum mexicanum TaxID=3457544 RepID=UPI00029FDF8B|nr:glycosyltransferase [Pseudanabaena sp. PCC 7367]AFY70143.1 glycosyl transferase group 1 [Pseudanabaena sp. PCC 7367]